MTCAACHNQKAKWRGCDLPVEQMILLCDKCAVTAILQSEQVRGERRQYWVEIPNPKRFNRSLWCSSWTTKKRANELLISIRGSAIIKPHVKYVRGMGYKIVGEDGRLVPGCFYTRRGAEDMLSGRFQSHAFNP